MDAFRPSRFSNGQEPWFRIGTLDVGSAGIVALVVAASMFVRAAEGVGGPFGTYLPFVSPDILDGQIWRMVTWWMPNEPSLWTVIRVVLIYLFGMQIEAVLGRERMATFIGFHVVGLAVIGVVVALLFGPIVFPGGASFLQTALFYTYIAYLPQARFFFGIPGWVIGAVFFVIQLLQFIEFRDAGLIMLLVLALLFTLLMAKGFGLADSLDWIPDLRKGGDRSGPARAAGAARTRKAPRTGRKSKRSADHLSVVPDEQRFEDMGIDDILDQINAFGMDSLSSEQKKILKQYSKGKKKND